MDDAGETRDDVRLPDNDLGKEIQQKFDNEEALLVSEIMGRSPFNHRYRPGLADG